MTIERASDNPFPSILMVEGDPEDLAANPAAGQRRLAVGTDHLLYLVDDAGVATEVGGGASSGDVATDAIWDAAGDLVQGTGANTAAKLTAGTAAMFLKSAGAAAANVWAFPPGHELDYVEFTSPVSVSATVEASANTVVSGTSQAYTADPILIEFFASGMNANGATSAYLIISLWDGGTNLGFFGITQNITVTGGPITMPVRLSRRLTPSAATHQYIVKAYTSGGQPAVVNAGAGGTATRLPGFIRITKA